MSIDQQRSLDTQILSAGFSKLTRQERFAKLQQLGALTAEDVKFLQNGAITDVGLAETFIENAIGYFQLPLGVATNFCIDNQDYIIPLAVEETSIIAALSKTAKWIKQHGSITTHISGSCILGQMQFAVVNDFQKLSTIFSQYKKKLIDMANNNIAINMFKRGGGVTDLQLRKLSRHDGKDMAVIHLLMNCCDAMGANIINQILEYLKAPIEKLTNETISMCILSNLNDEKLTHAKIIINNIDPELGEKIQEASFFAEIDPYRATTHNKGVMNGIDAVLIATGNDWRAVEAGVHAYATKNGKYQAITKWRYVNNCLIGELIAPIIVGTIGGVTSLHPTAKICMNMMKINSANHLSKIIAAVGLVQNLGAIRALCTEGIIQGHMRLHIDNLISVAGAIDHEIPLLKTKLQQWLQINKHISLSHVYNILAELRGGG